MRISEQKNCTLFESYKKCTPYDRPSVRTSQPAACMLKVWIPNFEQCPGTGVYDFLSDEHWHRETYVYSHNWQTVCFTYVGFKPRKVLMHSPRSKGNILQHIKKLIHPHKSVTHLFLTCHVFSNLMSIDHALDAHILVPSYNCMEWNMIPHWLPLHWSI